MKFLNYYDKLAGNDVRKIEESIKWWAENNPNGIMLIDEETLRNLRQKLVEAYGKPQQSVLELHMDEICICWTNVGGEKAILNFVYDNNGKVLYEQPRTWKESDLWYQFK